MLHGTKCLPTNESHGFRFHSQQFTTQFETHVVYHALILHNIYGYPHPATLLENVIGIIFHVLHCGEHALGFPVLRNHNIWQTLFLIVHSNSNHRKFSFILKGKRCRFHSKL